MSWLEETRTGCRLRIRVTPRSSRDHVDGLAGGELKIRLQAPPVEGQANARLIDFLAERLAVPRRALLLDRGARGRHKVVEIRGLNAHQICARLDVPAATLGISG